MTEAPALLTDIEFISLGKGDKIVFEKVYRLTIDLVYFTANRCGASHQESQEVAQDVYLKLFDEAANLDNKYGIKKWLVVTTRNRIIDLKRMKKNQDHEPINSVVEEGTTQTPLCIEDTALLDILRREMEVQLVGNMVNEICAEIGDDTLKLFYIEG